MHTECSMLKRLVAATVAKEEIAVCLLVVMDAAKESIWHSLNRRGYMLLCEKNRTL